MADQRSPRLVQTWVQVVDNQGRSHLEARWVLMPDAPPTAKPRVIVGAHAA